MKNRFILLGFLFLIAACSKLTLEVDPVTEKALSIISSDSTTTATLKNACAVNYSVFLDSDNTNNTSISQGIKDAFTAFNAQGLSIKFNQVTANDNLQIKFTNQDKFATVETPGIYQASRHTLVTISGKIIYLNRNFAWDAPKIKQVIMHTVGLLLGLEKSEDKTSFMNPFLSDSLKQITVADKANLKNLLSPTISTVTTGVSTLMTGAKFMSLLLTVTNPNKIPLLKTGFCWSVKNVTPTIVDSKLESSVVINRVDVIRGLLPNQIYYFRTYVMNNCEIKYGNVIKVTTKLADSWVKIGAIPATVKPRYEAKVVSTPGFFTKAYLIGGYLVSNKAFTNEVWEYYPLYNTWTAKAPFPGTPRWGATSVLLNNKIYYGLGYNNGSLSDWWEYDMALNKWTQKANCPEGGKVSSSSFVSGSTIVLAGGSKYDGKQYLAITSTYKYTPSNNTWANLSSATPTNPSIQHSYFIDNIPFLVIPNAPNHQLCQYNVSANRWGYGLNMPFNVRNDAQYMSTISKAFCGLGYVGSTFYSDWYEFTLSKNTWTKKKAPTTTIRNATKMTFGLEKEKIYIIGGFNASKAFINEVWEYNVE